MNRKLLMGALVIVGTLSVSLLRAAAEAPRPKVGAIRWDAWSGGRVTDEVQRTLAPAKYHDRLPWFAEVEGGQRVRFNASRPGILDQEIAFAAGAGLDFWAFLLYPESNTMSQALAQYLKSPQRRQINFCLILHGAFGVSEAAWPQELARVVALLKEPGYQTVLDRRPLVFAFGLKLESQSLAQRFAEFQRAAQAAGLNPYGVFMGWNPAADFRAASAKGFEAVSAYAFGSAEATFAGLCQAVEQQYWQRARAAGIPYIPLVTTGWDKRPRKDNPVSWEKDHAYHQQAVFPATATPKEIAAHLERALQFVDQNPRVCAANTILIYAWNEHDEGGWLVPTWTPGGRPDTRRLDAIGPVLRREGRVDQPLATVGASSASTAGITSAKSLPMLFATYYVWYHTGAHPRQPWLHWTYPSAETNALAQKARRPGEPAIASAARPLVGFYDSADLAIAEWHVQLAQAAGIDAFLVSWWDTVNGLDKAFENGVLAAAVKHGFKIALLDERAQYHDQLEHYQAMLTRALRKYKDSPAYLRLEGRPVVYLYQVASKPGLTPVDFTALKKHVENEVGPVYWIVDKIAHDHQAQRDGNEDRIKCIPQDWLATPGMDSFGFYSTFSNFRAHQYDELAGKYRYLVSLAHTAGKKMLLPVHPGHDNSHFRSDPYVMPRREGQTLRDYLRAATDARADFILVTSWNEWPETTVVEPSSTWPDPYLYLKILAKWKGIAFTAPTLPTRH